ncbi:putative aminopeptidase-2 [Lingula anatina]|uniref:Aminopeptidase-2 n=1 Tax=Lingula anatina TaxID=7574 RepID=A0A1S3IPU4_LINAN|nr:putative aminopeptidase-2 [Lingula anatina]|eukprot:XP_013400083.2 putative aminopeptidase-2 [Lingula anatina]
MTHKVEAAKIFLDLCGQLRRQDLNIRRVKSSVKVWSRPEAINQTQYALEAGVAILEYFEAYYDVPYPLPKQDMIAIPDFAAGAMENWGLITYRETALLYDPAVSSLGNKQSVAIIVSHELAHQWFGNLVSPLWWDDLWLNEGFASYVEYLGVDNFAKEFKLGLRFPSIDIQGVFRPDGLASSHPIYVPVGHPDEIIEIFDSISYNKGASIIRMMSYFLTEDTFRKGLTSYLRKHAYDVATHDDLWTSLSQEATGIDVKQVMDTWTLQMGYPVVKIDLDNTTPTGAVRVTQKHFLIDPSVEPSPKYPSPYNYKWEIPLTLTTSKQPRWEGNRIKWMSQTDITLDKSTDLDNIGSSDWVVANIQQYGYYRVNYNKKNWENIIRQLSTDHNMIHVINRAQLIDDAFNIARSGSDPDVDVILAMRTTKHLDKDFEYMPWRAALNNIGYIHSMLSRTSHFGNFKAYMLGLVLPLYNRHGWATIDDPVESFSRTSAIGHACAYGHQHCLDEATNLFRQWMNTPNPDANNPIKVDLKSLVYCYAIKNGGQTEWDWAYERYKKANVAAEKSKLIVALTCSNEPWILNRYLEYSMDRKEVRQQDAVSVMANIAGNSIGKSMAWNFFRANWDKIFAEYGSGPFDFSTLISSVTSWFNTEFELEQLQALMSSKGNLGSGKRAFEQAVEKTRANIKWMQANEQKLGDWLKSGGITPDPGTSNDVRLPSTLHPVYYKLDLKPDIYGNDPERFNFSGSVEITIFCNESTPQIKLHSNKLTIPEGDVELMDENRDPLAISNTKMDTENQFFILNLPRDLEKGKNYTLKMKFEGPLRDDLAGLYRSQYFSTARNKTVHIATTQMQPTDARKAFPCFDEPAFRAVFEVTLWRKDSMKSLSNMPIRSSTTESGGWVADHYHPTLKMSTYLLAFIICDFDYVENTTSRNTIVRVWARPEAKDQAYYALDAGVRILEYFEGYYNITFPLPKQDMIAIPDFAAGAMENWGLITYRETAVLYDPKVSSAGNKQWVAVVVSHELAHQWFGNLVTPLWWDDLWLNEGFASYVEYLGVDFIEPTFKMMEQFLTEALHDVFGYDGLANSHPIYVPVGHPDEINEIFDTISYSKGASIIRMMSHFLTEDLFRRGLTHYLNRHAYDVATHDDLWNALTEQTQKEGELMDVKTIMDTWTLQMGYPVVKINRDYSGHSATVTQSHFLIDPTVEPNPKYPSPFNYKWEVPLTFTTSVNPQWGGTDIRWMHKNDANFMLNTTDLNNVGDDGWVIGNLQQYGYYRVNYDRKNWDNILSQLQDDHTKINVKNRAQIIDDVFNIGSSGMDSDVDIVLAMETTKYLVKEVDYIPWETALISMGQTDRMLSKTGLYGNYQKYMLGQILPLYNKVGWEDTGDHIEQYVRVWARREAEDQTAYALNAGVNILEHFENYYNISFPLPKQDMIAIPDFAAGAMENWGLITYRETALLYDPKVSSASNKQRVAVVVSHELAHQWFGNLVSPLWWDDLWLNEGFASYVEYLGVDFIESTWKMMEQFLVEDLEDVFKLDGLANSHPIYVPVGHPDEINEIFDRISYAKGASIIRMMNNFLTEDVFRRGLTRYLNRHAYDVATHDDLWAALSEQTREDGHPVDVKTIMDTWTLQMGYPVVKINRTYSEQPSTVSQSHFLIDPTVEPNPKYPSPFNYKWEIPLTLTTSNSPMWNGTIRWMKKNDISLNTTDLNNVGDDGWVIGNLQQYGYYRVNYDRKNWDNILNQLNTHHRMIHVKNRAQIIDDAFNIANSGIDPAVDIELAMQTTKYLSKETEYIPWEAALLNVGYLDIMMSKTQHYGNYQKYMLHQILPLYNRVGWEDTGGPGEHLEHYNRINALGRACAYGYQPCLDKATEMFNSWMNSANPDEDNPIPPNLKSLVYCNAIKKGTSQMWDWTYERYKKANVASEQVKLLYGLSCSSQTWILSRYLEYAITSSEIRKQDGTSVIVYVARNHIGRGLAWDFIRSKWNFLMNDYGGGSFSFSSIIRGVTTHFNTQFELDKLNEFISSRDNLGSGQRAFEQAVEKTQANIKWMQANEKKLGEWLAANVDPTDTVTKPSDVRLPTTMLPNYYKLWLRPDIYGSDPETFTFDGVVEITMLCNETTKVIKVHTNKLTINSVELMETADNASVTGFTRSEDKARQFLVINAPENFDVGKNYTLKINFTGPLKDDLAGLYRSQYFSSTRNKTVHIATTQMQPTDARKAFPCFDEPAFKAVFEVTLWRKDPMKSLSNMPIRRTTTQDDWKLDHYFPTVKMPTYLLAFIICDFVHVERNTTRNTAVIEYIFYAVILLLWYT